jgi:PIN domain nuclease of toxin-antitoxin system
VSSQEVVLDTHAVVWWTTMPHLLSEPATKAIASAKSLGVPAIVFWEVSLLVRRGRLTLGVPVAEWAGQLLSIPRVRSLPLTPEIALAADALSMHADPADRFIVATAIQTRACLVSKDSLLRPLKGVRVLW